MTTPEPAQHSVAFQHQATPPPTFPHWLDRWCEVRWRALVTWIALTAVMSLVISLGHGRWIPALIDYLARTAPDLNALPRASAAPWTVTSAWTTSLSLALIHWFHPILLRLNLPRGVLWITTFSIAGGGWMLIAGIFRYTQLGAFLSLFFAAALPGLALIGARTRPWMIVPAAACFSAAVLATNRWLDTSLPIVAHVPYAAILLYGTQRIERQTAT